MSVLPVAQVADDEGMSGSSPRADGPSRRRSFNLAEKREHLAAYEAACENAEAGVLLRSLREGVDYSTAAGRMLAGIFATVAPY